MEEDAKATAGRPASEKILLLRTCIFSDHKKNNQDEEFYFECRPVRPRMGDCAPVCVSPVQSNAP